MNKTCAALAAGLLLPLAAGGQVDLHSRLLETRVLQYEPARVALEIGNNTGEELILSGAGQNATLEFGIEQSPGVPVHTIAGASLLSGAVSLKPQEVWTQTVDVSVAYDIQEAGPYTVMAQVEWGDKVIQAPKMFLDVLPGMEIAKLVTGIPGRSGEMRTYTLKTLNRDRKEIVFLRIDDEDGGRCYGVLELGRIVRMYKPLLQIDEIGNIHVLHQAGPSQFNHSVFTPEGQPVLQEQYSADGREIRLQKEDTGRIAVEGGRSIGGDGAGLPDSDGDIAPDEALDVDDAAQPVPPTKKK